MEFMLHRWFFIAVLNSPIVAFLLAVNCLVGVDNGLP
jgi:hypothetical protein